MTYLGFPVTFGYLEQTVLKGGEAYIHRGIDLGSWVGDRLIIGNTIIGITGESGKAQGPHTHVQAGRDEWAQYTIDPSPYIGQGGAVVKVGWGDQWGHYVCIRVGDVNVFYCHLQSTNVFIGQLIEDKRMIPDNDDYYNRYGRDLALKLRGRTLTREEFSTHIAGQTELRGVEILTDDPEAQTAQNWQDVGKIAVTDGWDKQIYALQAHLASVQKALANEQNKPPVEVIKEVEKIIEKPVEVVKEVPVYTHDAQLTKDVASIRGMLINFIGYVKAKLGR